MHHFLLSRRWIIIHLLTLTIVVVCASLALWQMGRLQDRQARNDRLAEQSRLPTAGLASVLDSADAGPEQVDAAGYRNVEIRGTYDPAEQVILQSREFKNRPGNRLLTPLVLSSGEAVLIDRGWVPQPVDDLVLSESQVPAGIVTVTGSLLPSEDKGFLGVSDPPPGRVTAMPRLDLERLADQLPYPLYPLFVRLEQQEPANAGGLPEPVPLPPPDDGPHREYALQWGLFALTATVVYGGLIRRETSRRKVGVTPDEPEPAGAHLD